MIALVEFQKLEELLKSLPVISRIDSTVEGISKDMAGEYKRNTKNGIELVANSGTPVVVVPVIQELAEM